MNSFSLGFLLQEILVNDDGDDGDGASADDYSYGDGGGCYGDNHVEFFCLLSSQLPFSTETAFKVKLGRLIQFLWDSMMSFRLLCPLFHDMAAGGCDHGQWQPLSPSMAALMAPVLPVMASTAGAWTC